MKIKLFFFLVIVFAVSCSRKTHTGTDYLYYKKEMAKAKKIEQQKKLVPKPVTTNANLQGKTIYLTKEERIKFATALGIAEDSITNEKLYHTIDNWLGVPYLWGGETKKGIDCSAFVQEVYIKVYEKDIPRTSIEQFYANTKVQFTNQKYLREGDLIFFRLRHKDRVVSHVGIYLQNGKFLGSNSPRGVEIANLNSNYWQDKYVASARLLNN